MRRNLITGLALIAAGAIGGTMLASSGTTDPIGVAGIMLSIAFVLIGTGVAILGI